MSHKGKGGDEVIFWKDKGEGWNPLSVDDPKEINERQAAT